MGVDYSGIGGIGIEITEERFALLLKHGLFTQEEWDNDPWYPLEKLKFPYAAAGVGNYTGKKNTYYVLVPVDNLTEIIANEAQFRGTFAKYGIDLQQKDLMVIVGLYVY